MVMKLRRVGKREMERGREMKKKRDEFVNGSIDDIHEIIHFFLKKYVKGKGLFRLYTYIW